MPALAKFIGPIADEIKLATDEDGHRTYTVPFLVEVAPGTLGAYAAQLCVAQHVPTGITWAGVPGAPDTADECAWCRPTMDVAAHANVTKGVNARWWKVTRTFSTKLQRENADRCNDTAVCDPLDEPQKISIDHSNYTEEAAFDRFGRRILSSSLEPIHGPVNEWEFTRTSVVIEQNVADPQFSLVEQMKDSVNAFPLWGLPARTIKFKPLGQQRKFRMVNSNTGTGVECRVYWTRRLQFDIRFRSREGVQARSNTGTGIELTPVPGGPYETWDRDVWDEGTRVLRGYWSDSVGLTGTGTHRKTHWSLVDIDGAPPDPHNPQHFIRFKDWNGENTKTLLDGHGKPAFVHTVEYKWWVLYQTYILDFRAGVSMSTLYLPCEAAKRAAAVSADLHLLGTVSVYGPYASREAAEAAIQAVYLDDNPAHLGDPLIDCPDDTTTVGVVHIEKYGQSDFLLLGVPTDFSIPLPPFTNP